MNVLRTSKHFSSMKLADILLKGIFKKCLYFLSKISSQKQNNLPK